MPLAFALQSPRIDISPLERAILETLAYSDVFDYPLMPHELHRYLTLRSSLEKLEACLSETDDIDARDGFYFLRGRADIVSVRLQRELHSRRSFARALQYGRILGSLPFIRMVALTGSLAVRNCDATGDYDYMLVAKTGRVWLARAFALVLNRIAYLFGETICPNLIVSEHNLEWSARNLYSAREICQMIPISGEAVYLRLRVANSWVEEFLPNDIIRPERRRLLLAAKSKDKVLWLQSMFELPLRGKLGDSLESWEMTRKIARFTHQAGYGLETDFNTDICQGNFDHHGIATMQRYRERLHELGIESPLPVGAPFGDDKG